MSKRRVSIVIPVYYNEANLPDTIPELLALREQLPDHNLELVFVDDGSRDRSLSILSEFAHKHPETIKVIKLTRNFGAMAAVHAGLALATGDCVGVIAADLQDPPELFVKMVRDWEQGRKAVFAVRTERGDPALTKVFAGLYYWLIRRYALPDYPPRGFDFFLIDRQVVTEVLRIGEKNTNLMSLIYWLGYAPTLIPYVRKVRAKGVSRWSMAKKIKLFVDSFVAFSYAPIRIVSVTGIVFALTAFLYGGVVFVSWAYRGIPVKGYAPTIILLALTAGIQMTMLGVLGEYLWRVLDEVRRRPDYVIDYIVGTERAGSHETRSVDERP